MLMLSPPPFYVLVAVNQADSELTPPSTRQKAFSFALHPSQQRGSKVKALPPTTQAGRRVTIDDFEERS